MDCTYSKSACKHLGNETVCRQCPHRNSAQQVVDKTIQAMSKFRSVICEADDIKFRSKKERMRYLELKALQKVGEVKYFLMQVPFRLPGNTRHLLDFLVVRTDGSIEYIEVKGRDLPMGKMKRKMVEDIYKIKITVD